MTTRTLPSTHITEMPLDNQTYRFTRLCLEPRAAVHQYRDDTMSDPKRTMKGYSLTRPCYFWECHCRKLLGHASIAPGTFTSKRPSLRGSLSLFTFVTDDYIC